MKWKSLRATSKGIQLANEALAGKKWKQTDLMGKACNSRQPISKFFTGKPVNREIFVKICEELGLDWREIVDLPRDEIADTPHTSKQVTGSVSDIKPVGKRALAIVNANAYNNAEAIAIAIANAYGNTYAEAKTIARAFAEAYGNTDTIARAIKQFIKCAHELKNLKIFRNIDLTGLIAQMKALKTQIPSDEQPRSMRESFTKHLIETWLYAFNLTSEMVNLSGEEIEALNNYLYANRLIIECKDAAVQVSPSTWVLIEERMLKLNNKEE